MNNLAERTAEDILGSIKIPPQPDILLELQKEMQNEHPDMAKMSQHISRDVGLCSAILRVINSPYYGMRAQIKSVHHAISLLGLEHIHNLIATVLFRIAMEEDGFTPMPRYWDNATDVARLSGFLARQLGLAAPDQAYTVGLFFDCGIPVLAQQFEGYKQVLGQQNQADLTEYTELEDMHFNTNHSVVGYYVTRSWGLPKVLREACLLHHDIEYMKKNSDKVDPTCKNLVAILKIAEHVANSHRNDSDYEWQRYKPTILDYLCMSEPDYNDLRDDMLEILNNTE